jgi:hypothetical protein
VSKHEFRTGDRLGTYVKQVGGSANWHTLRKLIGTELQVRSAGTCHCTLTFRERPTEKVTADEIFNRVIAVVGLERWLPANRQAGKIEGSAVENLALIQDDRIDWHVAVNAPCQLADALVITWGEDTSQRVKRNSRGPDWPIIKAIATAAGWGFSCFPCDWLFSDYSGFCCP